MCAYTQGSIYKYILNACMYAFNMYTLISICLFISADICFLCCVVAFVYMHIYIYIHTHSYVPTCENDKQQHSCISAGESRTPCCPPVLWKNVGSPHVLVDKSVLDRDIIVKEP